MIKSRVHIMLAALIGGGLIGCGSISQAQLLPGGIGALPGQVVGGALPSTQDILSAPPQIVSRLDQVGMSLGSDLPPASLMDMRRARLRALVRENRRALDMDDDGNPVRRDEILLLDPTEASLSVAQAQGFQVVRRETIDTIGISTVVLSPPRGKSAADGLKQLRRLDPAGQYDLNPVLEPAGGGGLGAMNLPLLAAVSVPAAEAGGARIGLIDGGVARHAAFASASIEQRGFAPGAPRGSGHGTAIASLLVGSDGPFRGAAPGAKLLVADIYGGDPAAGSAERIAQALGWMLAARVKVVTISLVGPPNRLMERAIAVARARGMTIVAAVGNDGPAAPPQYPASYDGVVAVTGVDAKNRALMEAGRARHLDFAAPGANMAAALPGKGYGAVRGTSFAAPLVAARLSAGGTDAAQALTRVAAEAQPGKGKVGRGIVCISCRIDPVRVGLKK